CQVLTLGTVAWASQQKTRTDLYVVEASEEVCENYQLCCNWFSDRIMVGQDGSFVASSFARELIADNLAKNKPWYAGISDKVNSNELFEKLTYERGGLYQMTKKAKYDERDKLFVEVCHEAIKFTYGKLSNNTKSGEDINSKLDRATIRMRTGLSRCKSADSFREFITDFWSRAGRLPTLQKHWIEIMEFITNQQQWKKARDLALLALASYKKDDTKLNQEEVEQEDDLIDIGL
ncbi:MAG: CRISPR-associated protein Cas8a1/Csx13, partial [Symploca sp. SIO2E9]|nr:CRISPR-associated protein Cas8a1/Csx13 [Symploca sp. SIO2E9]